MAVLAFSLLTLAQAHAQATRTWVSGVGDDANPCSRTAPCKTFAGAISKTAPGGEIDALDPGGFGTITITKSITIDGGGGQVASILASSSINGVNVNAGQNDVVTLRNLSINGLNGTSSPALNGVKYMQGRVLHIEHCAIFGFSNSGVDFEPSTAAEIFIDQTVIRDNGGSGIFIQGSAPSVIGSVSDSSLENNGSGLVAGSYSKITVRNSTATGNAGAGFQVAANSAAASMNIVNSTAASNAGAGIQAGGSGASATVRISGLSIFSNASALSTSTGGNIYSYGNNSITGTGAPTAIIPQQ